MALGSTVYTLDIDLADSDRGVYETLALRVARHPSESDDYLIGRVLAYCLEYTEGIEFSRGGLSDADEPPIAVRDLTGRLQTWIDVGSPDAARLHKAAKLAPRVAVYMHRDPAQFLRSLSGARIHRVEALELYALDRPLVGALAVRLERRMAFALSINERELYLSIGDDTLTGAVRRCTLD
ncbi:MAG: YaeQ family protein [Vicinamibacterales bacterium]